LSPECGGSGRRAAVRCTQFTGPISRRWRECVESHPALGAALDLAPRSPLDDGVLAEGDPEELAVEAEFAQHRQRVRGGLPGARIPGWNRAARAGLHQPHSDLPHEEGIDAVLGPGGEAAQHDIRSKALAVTRTRGRAMPRADFTGYTNSALTETCVSNPPPSNRASLEGRCGARLEACVAAKSAICSSSRPRRRLACEPERRRRRAAP